MPSNRNILLMTADEGSDARRCRRRPRSKLLAQGAEIIVGPLFGPSVSAVAPIARDRGVPVLAFSTEKSVAGNGVYLLSFLPQNEVAPRGELMPPPKAITISRRWCRRPPMAMWSPAPSTTR